MEGHGSYARSLDSSLFRSRLPDCLGYGSNRHSNPQISNRKNNKSRTNRLVTTRTRSAGSRAPPPRSINKMNIEIQSLNPHKILSVGSLNLPDGISAKSQPVMMTRDISESWNIAMFSVVASVPTGVIVGLILNHFGKDKSSTKITINRKEVIYEEGEIARVIVETKRFEKN